MVSQASGLELQMIFCNKNKSFLIKELIFCMFWNFCCCEVNWHFNLPALCRPGLDPRVAAAAVSPPPASPHIECAYISSASCTHRQSTPLTVLTRHLLPVPACSPLQWWGGTGMAGPRRCSPGWPKHAKNTHDLHEHDLCQNSFYPTKTCNLQYKFPKIENLPFEYKKLLK